MQPTIRDVAKKLNLSITTVSRALDGYADVAAATRELVIKTSQEMGYTPNRAARQLRRQRTDTIGYVIPSNKAGFADPFFSEFISGLGDEAAAQNYDLLVTAAAPSSENEKNQYQRWVQGGKVDGMVLNRVQMDDWRLHYLYEQHVPYVSLEQSPAQPNFIGIEADSYSGFLELIAYLVGKGHNRIAYIGGPSELKIDDDRLAGYQAGLNIANILFNPLFVTRADLTPEGGYREAERLLGLASPPTAIICVNDLTAIGAMHAAHKKGLKVGSEVAIAGFDGIADSAHTEPPLTTLDQPVYSMARSLVTMLIALMNGQSIPEKQVKIKPKLLIRESTGG
jgi:LacI family transcriptional regulator